jgi:zinc/manganese transport system permease protein
LWHALFLVLVVLNVLAAFQAMGTLMAVGLMMLPAVAARHWGRELFGPRLCRGRLAVGLGGAGIAGELPPRPALRPGHRADGGGVLGGVVVAGPVDGLLVRFLARPHLAG